MNAFVPLVIITMVAGGSDSQGPAAVRSTPAAAPEPTPSGPAATQTPTVVTSESLDMDYARNIATFTRNVHVTDKSGEMWADKMLVYFDPKTREVKRLVATGRRVLIHTRGRRSMSRKAVYTSQDGKIVLTGKPQIMQGQNTYTGDKITIFKDQDRVIFEPRARLVMYSDEEAGPLQELP